MAQIHRITNANVYCENNNLLGMVEEFTLPDVKKVMVDHKAMGMIGKKKYEAGIDNLELKIKFNSFYPPVFAKIAVFGTPVKMQFRSSVGQYTGDTKTGEKALTVFITATFTNYPTGAFKAMDNVELEVNMDVSRIKQVFDGVEIFEFDYHANILSVMGVDQMAQYRANLGI